MAILESIAAGSYDELDRALKEAEKQGYSTPLTAQNRQKELVIITRGTDFIELATVQHNGWMRINQLYIDGTTTETYER